MKSLVNHLNKSLENDSVNESLFWFPHIPSMEEIVYCVILALLAWQLLKYGGKCTLDFFKTLFSGRSKYSKTVGEILGEKVHNKIKNAVSNAIKGVSPKEFTKELIALKNDVSSGNVMSKEEVKEKLLDIVKRGGKLSDDDINEICVELEKFTKDEQRVKKLANALNIEL